MRRTAVTAAVLAASAIAAPAASARPLADGAAPGPHLTPAQLKAVNGHQPPEPLPEYVVDSSPLVPAAGSDRDGSRWILLTVPLALGLGVGGGMAGRRRRRSAFAVKPPAVEA